MFKTRFSIFALIFIALVATHGFAQKRKDYLVSFVDTTTGQELVGFKNRQGKIVIKARYNAIGYDAAKPGKMFETACVLGDSGWVFINRKDSIVLRPFIFDNGPDYVVEGLFRFVENGRIGFADIHCHKIIPAIFGCAFPFEKGIAKVGVNCTTHPDGEHYYWTTDEWFYINKQGKKVNAPGKKIRTKKSAVH